MEGATEAVQQLANAANAFVDEAQAVANTGVDTGQAVAGEVVHTALSAVEAVLAGVKALVAKV